MKQSGSSRDIEGCAKPTIVDALKSGTSSWNTEVCRIDSFEYLHFRKYASGIRCYGKTDFSWRGGKCHRFQISGRSGGQAAAGGLWNFSRLAGAARPQLQAAANRPEDH